MYGKIWVMIFFLLNFQVTGFPENLHQDFLGGLGLYHLPVKFKRGVTSSGLDRGPKRCCTGIFSGKKKQHPKHNPKTIHLHG